MDPERPTPALVRTLDAMPSAVEEDVLTLRERSVRSNAMDGGLKFQAPSRLRKSVRGTGCRFRSSRFEEVAQPLNQLAHPRPPRMDFSARRPAVYVAIFQSTFG